MPVRACAPGTFGFHADEAGVETRQPAKAEIDLVRGEHIFSFEIAGRVQILEQEAPLSSGLFEVKELGNATRVAAAFRELAVPNRFDVVGATLSSVGARFAAMFARRRIHPFD